MLWGERNGVAYGHHPKTVSRILEDAELWLLEFKSLHQHVAPSISSCSTSLSWPPPRLNELKLNVDTVVNDNDGKVAIGRSFEILIVLFVVQLLLFLKDSIVHTWLNVWLSKKALALHSNMILSSQR
ncbi:hypothetical protein TorRG33x02_128180 [Trema orientale]|uniref:Uncharacterized protein n=1 Tax=Trema orientale TaxID=63057 RepID=A0A2P5F0E9_TREOI|nr:hypothetical protein TorRG33x02_128180 [Trema orientale]